MDIEAVPEYEPKKVSELRANAIGLSIRAYEAAESVENFGEAVFDGKRLIDVNDVSAMVSKLRHYGAWLQRIADGEAVSEEELQQMESTIASIRLPKSAGLPKHEMIEIAYMGIHPETGRRTRKRIWSHKVGENCVKTTIPYLEVDLEKFRKSGIVETTEGE